MGHCTTIALDFDERPGLAPIELAFPLFGGHLDGGISGPAGETAARLDYYYAWAARQGAAPAPAQQRR